MHIVVCSFSSLTMLVVFFRRRDAFALSFVRGAIRTRGDEMRTRGCPFGVALHMDAASETRNIDPSVTIAMHAHERTIFFFNDVMTPFFYALQCAWTCGKVFTLLLRSRPHAFDRSWKSLRRAFVICHGKTCQRESQASGLQASGLYFFVLLGSALNDVYHTIRSSLNVKTFLL
jgi:hypothetical protein